MVTAFLATTLLLLSLELQWTTVWSASVKMKKDSATTTTFTRSETLLEETPGNIRPGKLVPVIRGVTRAHTAPDGTIDLHQGEVNSRKHTFQSLRLPVYDNQPNVLSEPNTLHMSTLLNHLTQTNQIRVEDLTTLLKLYRKTFRNNLLNLKISENLHRWNFVPGQRSKRDASSIQTYCGELTSDRCLNISSRTCVSMCVNSYMVRVCRRRNGCSITTL